MPEVTPYSIYTTGLYIHARAFRTSEALVYWSMPERLVFEDRDDTTYYEANDNELLMDIVIASYKDLYPNPLVLVGLVAEFQPQPIIDVSVPLTAGMIIALPSPDYIDAALGNPLIEEPEI